MDTDPATANERPAGDYVIGDHYDDTATLPLPEVAKRLERDILDVQGDGLIAREAAFEVTADESDPQCVVRATVSGLTAAFTPTGTRSEAIRATIESVFELASNYNRVDRLRPDRSRFLLAVDVMSDSGGVIGGVHRNDAFPRLVTRCRVPWSPFTRDGDRPPAPTPPRFVAALDIPRRVERSCGGLKQPCAHPRHERNADS